MHLNHLLWDIHFLRGNEGLRTPQFGVPDQVKATHYPIRLLRYWFMHHFIHNEFQRKGRTLSVCEVGVGTGQMLQFRQAALPGGDSAGECSQWVAVDVALKKQPLTESGYREFVECDLEHADFVLPQKYDVVILLHVLEHLHEPDMIFKKLLPYVAEGGILIGGFPSHPHRSVSFREKSLRKHARARGHVSAFSPKRVRDIARDNGLKVEFLAGAFLMRRRGFFLENFAWWMRFNLFFGALVPNWPGEIYWSIRKPVAASR